MHQRHGTDGYPERDIDYDNDHEGEGRPHAHDWDRPTDGTAPTHENRGPARGLNDGEDFSAGARDPETGALDNDAFGGD